nr:hypothetical protein CFP56_03103 [Quercus suber]
MLLGQALRFRRGRRGEEREWFACLLHLALLSGGGGQVDGGGCFCAAENGSENRERSLDEGVVFDLGLAESISLTSIRTGPFSERGSGVAATVGAGAKGLRVRIGMFLERWNYD